MIDITGMDKADILAALYNATKPRGLGSELMSKKPMDSAEARGILVKSMGFIDFIEGRPLKITLSGNTLDSTVYDKLNGEGTAARVIHAVKLEGSNGQT